MASVRFRLRVAPVAAVLITACAGAPAAVPAPTPPPTPATAPSPAVAAARAPSATPAPSESALAPGTTAIFRGGPAIGPWQQIGSVAEVTHPDAEPTARRSYTLYWKEKGLPDEVWDALVAEVSQKLVKLGPPADRPTFDGAPGSEPFNSGGGVERTNEQTGGRGIAVTFYAVYEEDELGVWTNFPFLLDPNTLEVTASHARIETSESATMKVQDAIDQFYVVLDDWVKSRPLPSE